MAAASVDNAVVSIGRLLRPERHFALGRNLTTPPEAHRALARALKRQRERLALSETEAVDVQLLGQVTSAGEWPKLLGYWERHNPAAIGTWPRRLDGSAHALNLWPLRAGRLGPAAGLGADVRKRLPKKVLCDPGLIVFNPEGRWALDERTALAAVCASWLEDVGMTDFQALRLAPPVLEAWAPRGRLLSRAVVGFGLDWPLPAADVV
jgi:hypothetical protein